MYFVKNCHQVLRALSEIDPTNGFEVVGEKTVGGMVFFVVHPINQTYPMFPIYPVYPVYPVYPIVVVVVVGLSNVSNDIQ